MALRANGARVLVANELSPERARVFALNYPYARMIVGDINERFEEYAEAAKKALAGRIPDFILATPPCQGMSKNGRGKLLAEKRLGRREEFDERNGLIIPAIKMIKLFRPLCAVFENVPELARTEIMADGERVNALEYAKKSLPGYACGWREVEFADYGVPQRRQRLIAVFAREEKLAALLRRGETFLPPKTHAKEGAGGRLPWVTVRDAIGDLPPLDAGAKETANCPELSYHRTPLLSVEKYFWVKHTPEGKSAFDNQCAVCGFSGNRGHKVRREGGVNRSARDTPVRCEKCGALLPRPWVVINGEHRLMRGYSSAYKRMKWDSPAPALTKNFSYACSDNKLHPSQNRVLSLREAFILHTLDRYDFRWEGDGVKTSDKTIREIIGESVPPLGLELVIAELIAIMEGKAEERRREEI